MGFFKKITKHVNKALGAVTNAATGGLIKYDGSLKKGSTLQGDLMGTLDPYDVSGNVSKGLEAVSGARSQRKALEADIALRTAEAKRQADMSDALSNEAANRESANIGVGRRRKSNKVSNAAGLGGIGQSDQTGVQS